MDAKTRAEKIVSMTHLWHVTGQGYLDEIVPKIAAQIEEAEREVVLEIAEKQLAIHGESVMLNGKLITNEELYKQPTDYVKEAYAEGFRAGEVAGGNPDNIIYHKKSYVDGFNAAREKAKGIAELSLKGQTYLDEKGYLRTLKNRIAHLIGEMEP